MAEDESVIDILDPIAGLKAFRSAAQAQATTSSGGAYSATASDDSSDTLQAPLADFGILLESDESEDEARK
jgi:hypothetical protein